MMPKSEMGWVLQHMADHGFCRDPLHRLGWAIGKVGFPIHFAGDKVECTIGKTSRNSVKNPVEGATQDTMLIFSGNTDSVNLTSGSAAAPV
jgi:hypothetical protein